MVDIALVAFAECDDDICLATARADHTAHIDIVSPFISLSNYAYPIVNTPVPLPAGALLLDAPLVPLVRRRVTA